MIFKFFLLFILVGCATIQRDIYFKSNGKHSGDVSDKSPRPGSIIVLEKTFLKGESITSISVTNSSNGVYLFGILIPIIPVFFLEGYKFELDKKQKLSVYCVTTYLTQPDEKGWKRIRSYSPCQSLKVIAGKQTYLPSKKEANSSTFIFNVRAADLERLTIEEVAIDDGTGGTHKFSDQFVMELQNKTHYHMPNVAP